MTDYRKMSPEFSEDYERQQSMASRYSKSLAPSTRVNLAHQAGLEAAWRAYPATADPPRGMTSDEYNAWVAGARSSFEWARMHEENGWSRIVDGVAVRP